MQSRTVVQLLALKLSGEATAEDLAELEQLIAKNPDAVYHQEILQQLFYKTEDEVDTEYYYNRHKLKYQDKLVFTRQTVSALNQSKAKKTALLVCSLLFAFSVAAFFIYSYQKHANKVLYNVQVISKNGSRRSLKLPDGTKVWLNSDSKLDYDKDMDKRSIRYVRLTGEAFFDVAHDKAHPFIIRTNKISIKVLGTAFNVKAYPTDHTTEATLIRGSIELSVNNRAAEKVILKPSEKFELIDEQVKSIVKNVEKSDDHITMIKQAVTPIKVAGKEYTEEVSWVDNQLVFNNETFREIVPKLERWYNIKLDIQREEINSYHFTGVFANEDLTEALTVMKLIKPFNFKIKEHDVTIY